LRSRNLPVLAVDRTTESSNVPATVDAQVLNEDGASQGMSLLQVSSIVRAYRKPIIIIFLVVLTITVAIVKIMPKTYEATATLMVNYESNDPLAAREPTGPVATYISTEMELMKSSEVLLPVIDALGLTKRQEYIAGYRGDVAGLREWVKDALIKGIDVEQGRFGSQLIYITAAARDPVLASVIANTLAETYLDQQRRRVFGPASERAKNYADELAELKHKVAVAQDQVTQFRQRTGVTDSAVQADNVEAGLLATLEQRYQDAQNQRRAAEVAANADPTTAASVLGSEQIVVLKKQLDDQSKQLAQLHATLGPSHPKIIELQNEIVATRRSLDDAIKAYSSNTSGTLTSARQLEQKLAAAVQEQRAKVLGVRKLQDEGTKYVLELESAQSVYKRALDGYDSIMFASGEHYTNVNFVSRAVPAMKAVKPNKPKFVLLGALGGLFLGLAAPFAYEILLKRRVRCRDDFERAFGLPVLSEFDAIKHAASAA
jgi:succinoglycan biosynthesis transport protein ExoP